MCVKMMHLNKKSILKIRYKEFIVNRQSRLKHSYKVYLLTKNALMWYHINSYIKVQMRFLLRISVVEKINLTAYCKVKSDLCFERIVLLWLQLCYLQAVSVQE